MDHTTFVEDYIQFIGSVMQSLYSLDSFNTLSILLQIRSCPHHSLNLGVLIGP